LEKATIISIFPHTAELEVSDVNGYCARRATS
jgi:hypothetical protein